MPTAPAFRAAAPFTILAERHPLQRPAETLGERLARLRALLRTDRGAPARLDPRRSDLLRRPRRVESCVSTEPDPPPRGPPPSGRVGRSVCHAPAKRRPSTARLQTRRNLPNDRSSSRRAGTALRRRPVPCRASRGRLRQAAQRSAVHRDDGQEPEDGGAVLMPDAGGGQCCANVSYCGGYVPGCFCSPYFREDAPQLSSAK